MIFWGVVSPKSLFPLIEQGDWMWTVSEISVSEQVMLCIALF